MEPTKLIYMEDMQALNGTANVLEILEEDGKLALILDQTIFYPQGGGQPFDMGMIIGSNGKFVVSEVRFVDGIVKHFGKFTQGKIEIGETVELEVDSERRKLYARLHSGGHIVDMAVNSLGLDWVPGKGYHFPDGPYVEYQGSLPENLEEREKLRKNLEQKMQEFVNSGVDTEIRFVTKEEMAKLVRHVPGNLPENKPTRIVLYGNFAVPCGGTHVANLSDIGKISIKKLGIKNGAVKVSYLLN